MKWNILFALLAATSAAAQSVTVTVASGVSIPSGVLPSGVAVVTSSDSTAEAAERLRLQRRQDVDVTSLLGISLKRRQDVDVTSLLGISLKRRQGPATALSLRRRQGVGFSLKHRQAPSLSFTAQATTTVTETVNA
jgi:hypothetical protein